VASENEAIGHGLETRDMMVQGPLLIGPEISILLNNRLRSMVMVVMHRMSVGGALGEQAEVIGTLYPAEDRVMHRTLSRETSLPQ
jgi:hypothetical protein